MGEATYPSPDASPTYEHGADAKAFVIDQKTDETTTVTDTFNGGAAAGPRHLQLEHRPGLATTRRPTRSSWRPTRATSPASPAKCTDYPNTARESADGTSDSETVTVCVGADLDVTKDANLGFQRELLWDIAKSGPGTVFVGSDGRAT